MYKRNQKQAAQRRKSKLKKKYSRVRHAKSTNHRTEIYDSYQSRLAQTLFLKDDIYRTITYKRNQKQAVGRRRIKFENKNDSRLQNIKKKKKKKSKQGKKKNEANTLIFGRNNDHKCKMLLSDLKVY